MSALDMSIEPCPMVTCVMPTFGRTELVAESIKMFLDQDYPNKELLIVNDCELHRLVAEYPQVRVVNLPERFGSLGEKRNFAISEAEGSLIAVWDDDDVYLPWRISASVAAFRNQQRCVFVPETYWAYWGWEHLAVNTARLDSIWHPVAMFTKAIWQDVGGYPPMTFCEDRNFFEKIYAHLGIGHTLSPVSQSERFMIMRGRSRYRHTSISGGLHKPQARPGTITLRPVEIADLTLRTCLESLRTSGGRD